MEGEKLGNRSRLGERQGPCRTHSLTHSLSQNGLSLEFVAATAGRECNIHDARGGGLWQPGGDAGTLAHLLTHSVSHCQFMFQTLQQLVRMVLYLGCKGQRAVPIHPLVY